MVLEATSKGLYCPSGDIYIDPSSKVKHAFITHAHSDHARKGSENYYCTKPLEPLLRERLNKKAVIHPIPFGKKIKMSNATISFHPAGHMLGSAQVRVEHNNKVWVVSGDYKREKDPSCEPFEVVKCDTFITEATFGHPTYEWKPSSEVVREIVSWYKSNKKRNTASVILCYSLGKSQRILAELAPYVKDTVYLHPTLVPYTQHYEKAGIKLVKNVMITEKTDNTKLKSALILAPPSMNKSFWLDHLDEYETAFVSGWAHNQASFSGCDRGFCLSDHADWPALIKTIEETEAKRVLITHGPSQFLIHHLRKKGIQAEALESSIQKIINGAQLRLDNFLNP